MSECEKCHGTGKETCSKCDGKKKVKCDECNGSGKHQCHSCSGSGKETCSRCGGTGNEIKTCPVCDHGKVEKTRWINCSKCHGSGIEGYSHSGHPYSCSRCNGRGQVKETYHEICPNCHGEYRKNLGTCKSCGGTGRRTCSSCGGKKVVQCDKCSGTGQADCPTCNGMGVVKCHDCEKREHDAKEKRERELREVMEKRERKEREERNRKIAAQEKKEAAEKAAKERKEMAQGCGCLLALVAIAVFLVWLWMEGFTMAGLSSIGIQIKNALGGSSSVALGACAKIGGVIVALLVAWKLIKGKKDEASTSPKKRWKFVVLGLLFGFLGVHLAYAKRWFLFLLLWASLIVGGVASDKKDGTVKPSDETPVVQAEQSGAKSESSGNMVENVGMGIWALLWLGGTLFIKKDGKGNRM